MNEDDNIVDPQDVRRRALKMPGDLVALVTDTPGASLSVLGFVDEAHITDDEQWSDLHKKLKTGKLKFATVKKTLGKSEQATE